MLIDFHTHAFVDKVADKAVAHLSRYYKVAIPFSGRLDHLLQMGAEAKLDALVLLIAATKPEQVKPANDWILGLAGLSPEQLKARLGPAPLPRIVPFGTYHPRDPHWLEEIRRLRAAGIRGLKLHPEFQGIDLADPALRDCFAEIENDFIVVFHVGDPRRDLNNLSTPAKIAAIAREFPRLTIVAAHLGGYHCWQEAFELLAGRPLYLDTSSTREFIPEELLRKLVAKHGTERLLFGSDYPLYSPRVELQEIQKLNWLSALDKERISGLNAARLLRLKGVAGF